MKRTAIKTFMLATGLLALASTASLATAGTNVGVSVNIGQPDFYGRIDIGNVPPPPVVYAQPMIIERPVHYVAQPPIYLRVPPGHAKHWARHCAQYHACGRPVYFVQDRWYTNEYAPRYRAEHGWHHDYDRRDHGHDRDDYRGYDHHDNGHGHGHGHGRD